MKELDLDNIDLSKVQKNAKARYWNFVLYPESMIENWQDKIEDILEYPFAYAIHDKDVDSEDEIRKTHVHILVAFPNTTTYKHVLEMAQRLGVCHYVEKTGNIRRMFDYLIHATDKAKKDGKYQYDPSARVLGNGFDIGAYEQIGVAEKERILFEIKAIIRAGVVQDFYELDEYIDTVIQDTNYAEVFRVHQSFLYNLMRSKYVHDNRVKEEKRNAAKAKMKKETAEIDLDEPAATDAEEK